MQLDKLKIFINEFKIQEVNIGFMPKEQKRIWQIFFVKFAKNCQSCVLRQLRNCLGSIFTKTLDINYIFCIHFVLFLLYTVCIPSL